MNTVIAKAAYLFRDCPFAIFIYIPAERLFYQVVAGQYDKIPVPQTMIQYLDSEDTFFQSFRKGNNLMVFYFLRIKVEDTDVVIMINSDVHRQHLNSVALSFNSILEESETSVKILRKSRSKLMKLLDGLKMPLFSVTPEYHIVSVNKALAEFLDIQSIPSIINKKCYQIIHGRKEPCPFCRMSEIIAGEHVGSQRIELEKDGRTMHYEHNMFPVYDTTGDLNEFGEFMFDITENFQLVESIEKYKERVKSFQKAEVDKMNEIGEMKRAYKDLEKNYDEIFLKNKKMSKALEKLFTDNTVAELIKLRQENRDIKNKLVRSATALKNFQHTLETQNERYNELSKRTIFQMERLINSVNKKATINDNDLGTLLKMVTDEIKGIRKSLKIDAPPEE